MSFPIYIELRRSLFLSFLLCLIHLFAILCIIAVPWPTIVRIFLVFPVVVSLLQGLQAFPFDAIRLHRRSSTIDCIKPGGDALSCDVLPGSAVFPGLIVLRIRETERGAVASLVLLPSHMSAGDFRVLKVWLRWYASADPLT